jgi:glycosyltransferase involved in cell wall biosynthesis
MNILEVVEACNAGVGRHVRSLCEDLVAQGHRLTVAYSPLRADEAFQQFVGGWQDRIHFVPINVSREVSPISDSGGVVALMQLIRREGPFDVIHGHSSKAGAIGRIAGRLFGIPTFYTPHSLILASPEISRSEAIVYAQLERVLGHWATSRIIAVSEDERDFILKHRLAPVDRIVVIPNAVDDRDLQCLPKRVACKDLGQEPLTFGAAMRFSPQKAPMNLVEAFKLLSYALPQVPMRLVIAGDGELFSATEERVREYGLSDKISLLGWRQEIREVFRELDVFVVSSLYEGFSYSVIEAMAAGLPVVCTNVFGTKETVSRIPGNVIVPAASPRALADGMKRMATMNKPGSLRRSLRSLGQRNHEYVRLRFRQSEVTRRTLEAYREEAGKVRQKLSH